MVLPVILVALVWPALIAGATALHALRDGTRPSHWPDYWLGALALAVLPGILLLAAVLVPPLRPMLSMIAIDWTPSLAADLSVAADPVLGAPVDAAPAPHAAPVEGAELAVVSVPLWQTLWHSPGREWLPRLVAAGLPVLALAYLLGVAVSLMRLAVGYGRVAAIVGRSRPDASIAPPANAEAWPVRVTGEVMTPFAWAGASGGVILVPSCLVDTLQAERLDGILAHEAAHLERRDPQTGLALSILAALMWFNPFVRALIARWRLAAELACDARALEGAGPAMRKAYAQTLLDALRLPAERALPCPSAAFSTTKLKDEKMRLMNILKGNAGKVIGLREKMALGASAMVLALAGCAGAASMAPEADTKAPVASTIAPETVTLQSPDAEQVRVTMLDDSEREVNSMMVVGEDKTGWRQVITYADGTRVEKTWDDLTPEEQAQIKADLARAEEDMVRARQDIERARADMETDMARVSEDVERERAAARADMERAREEMERARRELEADMISTEVRGNWEREMREEIARAKEDIKQAQRELEAEMNSPEFNASIEFDIREEMERAREELDQASIELEQDLEELRRDRQRIEELDAE